MSSPFFRPLALGLALIAGPSLLRAGGGLIQSAGYVVVEGGCIVVQGASGFWLPFTPGSRPKLVLSPSSVISASEITLDRNSSLVGTGTLAVENQVYNNGLILADTGPGATLSIEGDLFNEGTIGVIRGTTLEVLGATINDGTIDLLTGLSAFAFAPTGYGDTYTPTKVPRVRTSNFEGGPGFEIDTRDYHSVVMQTNASLQSDGWTDAQTFSGFGLDLFVTPPLPASTTFYRFVISDADPAPGAGPGVVTAPVGAMISALGATTQVTTSYLTFPLISEATFEGPVGTVGANTFTLAGDYLSEGDDQFNDPTSPHFVRITSGAQAGRCILITGASGGVLTVDTSDRSAQTTALNTPGFALVPGDTVEFVPAFRLGALLGRGTGDTPLLLTGGTSAFGADTVGVFNKTTGKFDTYYFNATSGYWRLATVDANANDLVLYPEAPLAITRRAGRPALTLWTIGQVPLIPALTKVTGGNQAVYSATRLPVATTLGQLGLSNWTRSNSAFTADTLQVFNATTAKFDTYYQRLDSTWRKSTDATTDQSALPVGAGTPVNYVKRASVSGAASYLTTAIPYPVN